MEQEGTYKWIQDKLRDLHAGSVSAEDIQKLRDYATRDPFVADALEGFELHRHHDHTTRLNTITHRIRRKHIAHRRFLVPTTRSWVLQAVAACVILLIATWAVLQYLQPGASTILVSNEVIVHDTADAFDATTTDRNIAMEEAESSSAIENTTPSSGEEAPPAASTLRTHAQSRAKEYLDNDDQKDIAAGGSAPVITDAVVDEPAAYTIQDPDMATAEESKPTPTTAPPPVAETYSLSKTDEGLYANQMNPAIMAKRVAGIITNESGEPLIGANLAIQNTNLGTISDAGGRFELFLPAPESVVDVTYSGYVDASVNLHQGEEDIVIRLPAKDLVRQQVMVEKQNRVVDNVPAGRAYSATRPRDHDAAFQQYLRENTKFPLEENVGVTARHVMLQFDINAKGRPDNIEVISSSGNKAIDDEAQRLIRRGPDWTCEMDLYPCKGTYTIYFRF